MPSIVARFGARPGFARMFQPGALTLGLFFPLESYAGPIPRMDVLEQTAEALLAEERGFAALWARDVPLFDPAFGDTGQMFDPWVWLTHIAGRTSHIALATGSTVLPLRNPIDIAKASASLDLLSGERLVLGAATGDRGVEFPAFGLNRDDSGELFRASIDSIRRMWAEDFPVVDSPYGVMRDVGLLPKPADRAIPMLVTGRSKQSLSWIAEHADGWLMYPRPVAEQHKVITEWRQALDDGGFGAKPFAQSLYIDLTEDPGTGPYPIHLGYRAGHRFLIDHLGGLREAGVNHVVLNFKHGRRPATHVLRQLAEYVLPHFPTPSGTGGDRPAASSPASAPNAW